MSVLKLVANHETSSIAREAEAAAPKSHLDIAIENSFIQDIHQIMISADNGRFHLSLKTEVEGHYDSIWMNVFGDKETVAERAMCAIRSALDHGFPKSEDALRSWQKEIRVYMQSPRTVLLLPE